MLSVRQELNESGTTYDRNMFRFGPQEVATVFADFIHCLTPFLHFLLETPTSPIMAKRKLSTDDGLPTPKRQQDISLPTTLTSSAAESPDQLQTADASESVPSSASATTFQLANANAPSTETKDQPPAFDASSADKPLSFLHEHGLLLTDSSEDESSAPEQSKDAVPLTERERTGYGPDQRLNSVRPCNGTMREDETPDQFIQRLPPSTTQEAADLKRLIVVSPKSTWNWRVWWHLVNEWLVKETDDRWPNNIENYELYSDLELAAWKFNVKQGKWIFRVPLDKIDKLWKTVVEKTINGQLGYEARVALDDESQANTRAVLIYVDTVDDVEAITHISGEIWKMAPLWRDKDSRNRMFFKPRIYAGLGLFSGNMYDLKTSIYRSDWPNNKVTKTPVPTREAYLAKEAARKAKKEASEKRSRELLMKSRPKHGYGTAEENVAETEDVTEVKDSVDGKSDAEGKDVTEDEGDTD